MKKLFVAVLCMITCSLQAQRPFFYNNGTQVYYQEDQRSAIMIVSGDSNAVMRVGYRLRSLSDAKHFRTYFTSEDDVVYLYGDSLCTMNMDSIIRYASGNALTALISFRIPKLLTAFTCGLGTKFSLNSKTMLSFKIFYL